MRAIDSSKVNLHGLRVPTLAMDRLYQEINSAIHLRRHGMLILSNPGAGISTALGLIHEGLEKQQPHLLVERCMGVRHQEREFWRHFLIADNGLNGVRFNNAQSRARLINRLCQRAGSIQADQCVLLVDRAHDMDAAHFDELSRFEDDMRFHGLDLMLCFVGHHKIERVEDLLLKRGITEPSMRYFATRTLFKGISHLNELKYYLSWFDTQIIDEINQSTITQASFGEAYGVGWRLEDQAHIIWTHLQAYLSANKDLQMQPLHEIVASVLQQGRDKGRGALPPTPLDWSNVIERSNLPRLRGSSVVVPHKGGKR